MNSVLTFIPVLTTGGMTIAGLVMFFLLRLGRDPDIRTAGKVSLVLALASLLQVASALPELTYVLFVTLASIPVSFVIGWALTYVGLTLSMRKYHAFWLAAKDGPGRKKIFLMSALGAVLATAYSLALFALTNPQQGGAAKMLEKSGGTWVSAALFIVIVSVSEEFTYRGVFQNMLDHWLGDSPSSRTTAVVASSALWTVAHVGSLNPDWVKFVQIFPIGLFLGWQFRRHGLLATVATHLLFNILVITGWSLTGSR